MGIGMKNPKLKALTARDKGEKRCRHCGSIQVLHAHHAVPRSLSRQGRSDLRNIIVLCARCHFAWHRGGTIPRTIFTRREWAFIRTLIGPGWLDKRYPDYPEKESAYKDGHHDGYADAVADAKARAARLGYIAGDTTGKSTTGNPVQTGGEVGEGEPEKNGPGITHGTADAEWADHANTRQRGLNGS